MSLPPALLSPYCCHLEYKQASPAQIVVQCCMLHCIMLEIFGFHFVQFIFCLSFMFRCYKVTTAISINLAIAYSCSFAVLQSLYPNISMHHTECLLCSAM